MSNKSKRAIRYGDRTFQGWADYYALWGVRKPGKRTICAHYAECMKAGMSEQETIAAQKRLWIEGITKTEDKRRIKCKTEEN